MHILCYIHCIYIKKIAVQNIMTITCTLHFTSSNLTHMFENIFSISKFDMFF